MKQLIRRNNLVFARVGRLSLHRTWLVEPTAERNWALQLSTYDQKLGDLDDGDMRLSVDLGTKWDSICRYFRENPELLDEYEYVMFPDDDLLFDQGGISLLFATARANDLDIAQPSLLPSSFISYPITMHCPAFMLRYTNYIEAMCPIVRSSYLKTLLPSIERWPTGWGQDDIWAMLMPNPIYRAAFIDAAPIIHTRMLYTGELYRTFERLGMDPESDLREVRNSFDKLPNAKLIYGGITKKNRKSGRMATNLRNGLHLIRMAGGVRQGADAIRVGCGMIARMVTRCRYRPAQLKILPAGQQNINLMGVR
jgi:hypothetical protein